VDGGVNVGNGDLLHDAQLQFPGLAHLLQRPQGNCPLHVMHAHNTHAMYPAHGEFDGIHCFCRGRFALQTEDQPHCQLFENAGRLTGHGVALDLTAGRVGRLFGDTG
jgi:hypothetical protein